MLLIQWPCGLTPRCLKVRRLDTGGKINLELKTKSHDNLGYNFLSISTLAYNNKYTTVNTVKNFKILKCKKSKINAEWKINP